MSSVSASSALGALPARFRRQRVLIVGCGDVGLRGSKQHLSQAFAWFFTEQDARETLCGGRITHVRGDLVAQVGLRLP